MKKDIKLNRYLYVKFKSLNTIKLIVHNLCKQFNKSIMQNCNQLSQLQQLCCVCFFIEGKTDPMERQVIIMYTLTIKQINLSFCVKIVCAETRMQGKL